MIVVKQLTCLGVKQHEDPAMDVVSPSLDDKERVVRQYHVR